MNFLNKAKFYLKKENLEIVREIILSIIVSTIVSSAVAFYFNKQLDNRISSRQFIFDFSRTFADNPKYRSISTAIEEQYFYNKEDKISSITEYDLDDYLGLLSDIWSYHRDGYISEDLLNNQYSYYLCVTYKSKLINEYRTRLTDQGFSDNWSFLDEVENEFNFKENDCREF